MKIVGIDLAVNNTGIAKWEDGEWEVKLISTVKNSDYQIKETEREKKFIEVRDYINFLISEWKPDLILFEGLSFGSRGDALYQLGMINGIILILLYEAGYNIQSVPPTKIKKSITGNGRASKLEVALAVSKKLGFDFSTIYKKECEHLYDAVSIVYYYLKESKLLETEKTRKRL
jgi:crossover junction endodeoxyribonuclease RuvC